MPLANAASITATVTIMHLLYSLTLLMLKHISKTAPIATALISLPFLEYFTHIHTMKYIVSAIPIKRISFLSSVIRRGIMHTSIYAHNNANAYIHLLHIYENPFIACPKIGIHIITALIIK